MGLSFGGSTGGTSSSTTSSSNQNKTFSAPQTNLQDQLGANLSSGIAASTAGTMSPGVAAQETASADQINKTDPGLQSRVQRVLAARGFGQSGESGKVTLASELGRQSDLASNQANFAGIQQNVNSQNLLAALNYAFTNLGTTASGSTSGSSSGWNVGGGATVGFGGGGGGE